MSAAIPSTSTSISTSNSNAESWDSDPDLVLPDGPLTLLHSDTEPDPETSSSSLSAFFSNVGSQSVSSVGIDDQDPQDLSVPASPRGHNPHVSSDDTKGNTLTLKKNSLARNPSLHFSNFTTPNHPTPSDQPVQDHHHPTQDHSFSSSTSSSECQQSTIKLSTLTTASQTLLSSCPSTRIDHAVLAVLASGTQGSVTRLESSKKPSPIQAGFDWDQDIVLPEGGLRALLRPTQRSDPRVKKKYSFASAISDDLEDLNLGTRSVPGHASRLIPPQNKSNVLCATVDEEGGDLDNDFELPSSSQALHLTDLKQHSRTSNNSKPSSVLSLDLDNTDNDPHDVPKSSTSSRRGSILRTTAATNSTSTSMSLSVANRSSIDDSNTPRIRTRPSLTPSLMSDRSSCSFPENEDDINEGFFDDIEFPPEFGIPNPVSAPSSSADPPNSSTRTPKPTQPSLPDSKGKQSSKSKSVDLQSYLNSKIQARAVIAERNNSSLSQQIRQNISTYEDRDDERVEDGLEIDNGSIHPANLRTRKTSSMSSTSSLAPQPSSRNSYFQQPHGHRFHHASSSTGSNLSQPSKPKKPTVPNNRSGLINNHADSRTNSPVPSSSTTLSRRLSAPQTTSLINRPHSVIPALVSHSSRQPAVTYHRPISAAGVVPQASKTLLNGSCVGAPISDSLPRVRTKSCRSIVSDGQTVKKYPPTQSSCAPSGRVQSPLGPSSLGTNRTGSKAQQSSLLRTRISTTAASSYGPPVLSASNQRTLKHKKSAAAIKSVGSGSSDLRSAYSSIHDNTSSILSPPGSTASSSQRRLHRKQSMPSLNHSHHHSTGSEELPARLERAYQPSAGPSSIWKSHLLPKSRSKQHMLDHSSSPSSPTFLSGSVLPSYADPTRASLSRHVGSFGMIPTQNGNLPDRSASVNSRRSSSESVRMNATSPTPPPPSTINTAAPIGGSRLTMPTIASRLKAKPSIIHEENGNNSSNHFKRLKASGITGVIPQQLRRPRRLGNYGDGTELDEFDDLPTSKEKEKMFTRVAIGTSKNNQTTIKGSNKSASFNYVQPTGGLIHPSNDYQRKDNNSNMNQVINQQRSKNRLETRKAEGARRRALAINNSFQVKKNSSKKGLIRQMSGNTLSQLSNNSEMRWNDAEARWEGNEHILREFDNALSTSSRPALISQLSIQSPLVRSQQQHIHSAITSEENQNEKRFSSSSFNHKVNKAQNHVVGGMIFDSESMSWKKISGDDEEDNLNLESDEELELRWLADDESSKKRHLKLDNNNHHSNYYSGNIGSSWNSFSSSFSLNQNNHGENNNEEDLDLEDHVGASYGFIAHNAKNERGIISGSNGHGNGIGFGKRSKMIKMGSFWKACSEAEERHKKEVQSWIPVDHQSITNNELNGDTDLNAPPTPTHSSKYGLGNHSYGRLTDSDRFYLQEIRKLVLEEEI